MASVNALEATAGLALTFFLPGFALARATFPEWRFRGPGGTIRIIETLTLSLFGSVAVTIVVGYGLLSTPVGFQATWSNPLLFEILAGVSLVLLVVAGLRGAFARVPPAGPTLEPNIGNEGAFETIRELDGLKAEERRLRHRLRVLPRDHSERERISDELERLIAREAAVVAAREVELNAE
jgi:uncharacterized protein DUF1616